GRARPTGKSPSTGLLIFSAQSSQRPQRRPLRIFSACSAPSAVCKTPLEAHARSELDGARIELRRHLAEVRVAQIGDGIREVHAVEGVERVDTKLGVD